MTKIGTPNVSSSQAAERGKKITKKKNYESDLLHKRQLWTRKEGRRNNVSTKGTQELPWIPPLFFHWAGSP